MADNEKSLEKRIEKLEKTVENIQRSINEITKPSFEKAEFLRKKLDDNLADLSVEELSWSSTAESAYEEKKSSEDKEEIQLPVVDYSGILVSNEYWLNKIGIALLLLGLAFLFKYSVDQGWLTPPIRILFGLILGTILLITGNRTAKTKRHFSRVMFGGGVATFYITIFAAFELYKLADYPSAFILMVAVTLLSFLLSLKYSDAVLSIIGTAGGLSTPFVLYSESMGSAISLVGYICLIIAGSSAIYFFKGWRSVLSVSAVGGWLALVAAFFQSDLDVVNATIVYSERLALQFGIAFAWLAFWAIPVIREVFAERNLSKWVTPRVSDYFDGTNFNDVSKNLIYILSTSAPIISMSFTRQIWQLSNEQLGWIAIGGAVVYVLSYLALKRLKTNEDIAYTQLFVGVFLLSVAFALILEGNVLLFTLTAEATLLHLIAYRLSDKFIEIKAHILFAIVGAWLFVRLLVLQQQNGVAVWSVSSLTDISVILAAFAVSFLLKTIEAKVIYRLFVHIAFLGWLLRELATLPEGQAYVTVAWGIYAVILLVIGLQADSSALRTAGMATIFLVVGKLFLFDLINLEAIWRILLFLGFGGLFLILSYYFQSLWKSDLKS